MDYNYDGYDRGYTEPAMTSADYMNRTYRWMAVGLLITFAAAVRCQLAVSGVHHRRVGAGDRKSVV